MGLECGCARGEGIHGLLLAAYDSGFLDFQLFSHPSCIMRVSQKTDTRRM